MLNIHDTLYISKNKLTYEGINMQTNDRQITDLMKSIDNGTTQLPDFQRGWVWDDNRIRALIASITNNFPVGAAMFLECKLCFPRKRRG